MSVERMNSHALSAFCEPNATGHIVNTTTADFEELIIKNTKHRWLECMTKQHAVIKPQKRHLRTKDISNLGITWLIYSKSWEASPVTPKCHQLQIQRLNSFKHGISRVWGLLHGYYDFSGGTRHPLKTASTAPSSRSFSRFSLSSNSSSSSNFSLSLPTPISNSPSCLQLSIQSFSSSW